MQAVFNGTVIAESDQTVIVEGNHYFPADSIKSEFFAKTATHTTCAWKGKASYYTVTVDGQSNRDAAWFYPSPTDAAAQIKDHVAFWKGIQVKPAAAQDADSTPATELETPDGATC